MATIVAFDTDDKADGSGKAGITWISKDLLPTGVRWNNTATTEGGWEASNIRSYLKNTVKPLIPATVRNNIVEVSKISSTYENGAKVINGQTTVDDVWIPSSYEVNFGTSYESVGAKYGNVFTDATSRIKKHNNIKSAWWLRTVSSVKNNRYVNNKGWDYSQSSSVTDYFALGFCTN